MTPLKFSRNIRGSHCGDREMYTMKDIYLLFLCAGLIVTAASELTTDLSNNASEVEPPRDEALNEYFRDILLGLRLVMPTGLAMLKLPMLDPLSLGEQHLNYRTENTRLNATFSNVSIQGLSTFEILDLNVGLPTLQVSIRIRIPELLVDGLYHLNGVAMYVLPLRGQGPWHVRLFNLTVSAIVKLEYKLHNDLRLRMLSIVGDVDDSQIQFQNLLDKGNLGQVVNRILQINSRRLLNEGLKELRSALEHAIAQYIDVLDTKFIIEMSATNSSITQTP